MERTEAWDNLAIFVAHLHKGGRLTPAQENLLGTHVDALLECWQKQWLTEAADIARESVKRQILFGSMVSADQVAEDVIRLAVTTEPGLAGKGTR